MYTAPLADMQFLIDDVIDVAGKLGSLERFVDVGVGPDLTTALLEEAGKLGSDVVAP
ncbi:acyl-CoA dehydrogenase N-terminal domain-containing protein, partial [Luminiphilus sp.]|nr:acyl-CoA dehydrogenase N-terminal domain-containing protein [Luminiphilus sp.]